MCCSSHIPDPLTLSVLYIEHLGTKEPEKTKEKQRVNKEQIKKKFRR